MPQPQGQSQQLIAITKKKGKRRGVILIQRKTGYQDVTINGQRFYHNYQTSYPMNGEFDVNNLYSDSNRYTTSRPRQTIIITRKK